MKRYIAQKIETRPVDILLVEDNPGDVRLTIEAMTLAPATLAESWSRRE